MKASEKQKLTPSEERLLKLLSDPDNWGMTQEEQAEAIGISAPTVCRAFQKPYFIERINEVYRNALGGKADDLLNAGFRYALEGSPTHFKILTEMIGLYNPRATVKHEGDAVRIEFSEDVLSEDEEG